MMDISEYFPLTREHGDTPLHTAMKEENIDVTVIQDILERGENPNVRNDNGAVCLHYAMFHPNADFRVVRMLIEEYGANVDIIHLNLTPLHWILYHGPCKSDVALELMRCGADVNAETSVHSLQPLHLAVRNRKCDIEIIKELIERGADVNSRINIKSNTPLHEASCNFRLDAVKELLQNGAQVWAKNSNGETCLRYFLTDHLSWKEGADAAVDIVKELVKYGADVNERDDEGITPLIAYLHWNSSSARSLDVVRTLLDFGADVNAVDSFGDDPLMTSLDERDASFLLTKELLDRGADTRRKDCEGGTSLHRVIATYRHHPGPAVKECVELMIKYTLMNSEELLELISRGDIREFLRHEEFHGYASACFTELVNAKTIEIFDSITLYTMIRSRSIRNSLSSSNAANLNVAVEKVLAVLAQEKFPLFNDLIKSLLMSEKQLLFDKLKELSFFARSPGFRQTSVSSREIILDYDSVCQITKYLSDSDILCLILAYSYESTV